MVPYPHVKGGILRHNETGLEDDLDKFTVTKEQNITDHLFRSIVVSAVR